MIPDFIIDKGSSRFITVIYDETKIFVIKRIFYDGFRIVIKIFIIEVDIPSSVDPLIFEGVRCGVHAALTSVGSHYGGVDFDPIGRGYASGKSDSDILTIGSVTARGAEVLAGKLSAACIRRQYQTFGMRVFSVRVSCHVDGFTAMDMLVFCVYEMCGWRIHLSFCVPLSPEHIGARFSLGASPRGLNNARLDGAVGRRG